VIRKSFLFLLKKRKIDETIEKQRLLTNYE
jgi:hypothetical protein